MKKGLVLEGGGMRGMFTAGVLDVLLENDIHFDMITGVSAGAAFGCNYKSKQKGRVLRYNLKYCRDPRFSGIRNLITTGNIFGAEFCYHTIPDELDVFDRDTYNSNDTQFYVVATDTETGQPVYINCPVADYDFLENVRASASLPLVSRPVEIDGRSLLDGGIGDSIPLKFSIEQGCDKNIVILTRPREYRKEKSKTFVLSKPLLYKYPNIYKAMKARYLVYNRSRDFVFSEEKKGRAFVILPESELDIGKVEHDEKRLQKAYDDGYDTAKKMIYDIKKYLVC